MLDVPVVQVAIQQLGHCLPHMEVLQQALMERAATKDRVVLAAAQQKAVVAAAQDRMVIKMILAAKAGQVLCQILLRGQRKMVVVLFLAAGAAQARVEHMAATLFMAAGVAVTHLLQHPLESRFMAAMVVIKALVRQHLAAVVAVAEMLLRQQEQMAKPELLYLDRYKHENSSYQHQQQHS